MKHLFPWPLKTCVKLGCKTLAFFGDWVAKSWILGDWGIKILYSKTTQHDMWNYSCLPCFWWVFGFWNGQIQQISPKGWTHFQNYDICCFFHNLWWESVVQKPKDLNLANQMNCWCITISSFWSTSVPPCFGSPHVKVSFWSFSSLASSLVASWKSGWQSQMCVETTCRFSYILKVGKPNINPLRIVPPCGTASKLGRE